MAGDRRRAGVFCMGERFNVVTGLAVQPRPDHPLRGILGSVGTEHCPSPPTLMPRVPQTLCSGTAGIRLGFQEHSHKARLASVQQPSQQSGG